MTSFILMTITIHAMALVIFPKCFFGDDLKSLFMSTGKTLFVLQRSFLSSFGRGVGKKAEMTVLV